MKRLTKYIAATRHYEFVIAPGDYASTSRSTITAYVDSDWAGCKATRKSTVGAYYTSTACVFSMFSVWV